MLLTITINTDNYAFGKTFEERDEETARILTELAKKIRIGEPVERIRDSNGEAVGRVEYRQ